MASQPVNPIVLKDCTLLIGADNYEAHVSTVRFDPSNSTQQWQGMTPSAGFTDTTSSTWTCTLTLSQSDLKTGSLARYLFDNEGTSVVAKFTPKKGAAGSMVQVTATLNIVPPSIGGDVNAWAVSTVTLGVSGKPALATL